MHEVYIFKKKKLQMNKTGQEFIKDPVSSWLEKGGGYKKMLDGHPS